MEDNIGGVPDGFPGDTHGLAMAAANDIFQMDYEEIQRIQLEGARAQFKALRTRIPVLDTLAKQQAISQIDEIDSLPPLLFSHQLYKSYPMRLIERGEFQTLTAWLDGLTSYDLSKLEARECDSLDSWSALIERSSPLRLHAAPSVGGKLAFLPRDKSEVALQVHGFFVWLHQGLAGEANVDLSLSDLTDMPCVFLNYRKGPHQQRVIDALVATVYSGNESQVYALYPGAMSLDVMALAGRLKAADERGIKVAISPSLQARRLEYVKAERRRASQITSFFERISAELSGQRILYFGSWSSLLEGDALAKERNMSRVFAPDSIITTGGGYKGGNFNEGWFNRIVEFLGVPNPHDSYGSAEQMIGAQYCPADHYHFHPLTIPFLLDPVSGTPLEKRGLKTGRFAFLNLAARSAWGGFVTGDEVTIEWDRPCECGRKGPYLHRQIRPYSAEQDGEDKITCAGMPTAHRRALDYLADI